MIARSSRSFDKPSRPSHAALVVALLLAASGCTADRHTATSSGAAQPARIASPFANLPPATATPAAWYENEIQAFEKQDRENPPTPGQVLFVGSSSFRLWTTLERDMAPAPVLNRGFGGSKTGEVLAVFDRVVTPYKPSVIAYYCGDNDLGTDNTDSLAAANGFVTFAKRAHEAWPGVNVVYVPIKPSLARWSNWDAMKRANELVREYCESTPGMTYADTATPMLIVDAAGKETPDPTLFREDGLHVNEKGYAVWTPIVRAAVLKARNQTK